jgi:GNAT superfamily N-acetyltransferase
MLDEVDNLSSPKSFSAWDITSDPVEVFDEFGELTNVVDGPEYALIEKIYVDPSERGQGAARNLLRESIAEIQEKHPQLAIKLAASQLEKGTDLDQLVSFYENEGFISLPVEPGMDFIPMEYRGGKIDDLDLYSGGGR